MKKINLNSNTVYHKTINLLLIIFLVILPFNAILKVVFAYKFELGSVNYVKEIILILLAGMLVFQAKQIYTKTRSNLLILLTIVYLGYICLSYLWLEASGLKHLISGFKYDGLYLVCLLIGFFTPKVINKNWLKYLKISAYSSFTALVSGLGMHFIIKPENLTFLGYRNDWSTHIQGESLAFCQKIENNPTCRFQGVYSGPNQAGANILLLFTSIFILAKNKVSGFVNRYWLVTVNLLAIVGLVFTFSRSSWLAFVLLILLLAVNSFKNHAKVLAGLAVTLVIVTSTILLSFPESVFRYGSNSDRVLRVQEGIQILLEKPFFGHGIGYSGPASHARELTIISENWFIQIAINYGLIGLLLFVLIYFVLIRQIYIQKSQPEFMYLLIALLIPLNLLHYFEDSSFSYGLFLILGLFLASKTQD